MLQWGIFLFFGIFTVAGTLFVYFLFPETKGIPIEEVPNVFKRHWYWRRFVTDMPGTADKETELARTSAEQLTETPQWVQDGDGIQQGLVSIWSPKSDEMSDVPLDGLEAHGTRGLMRGLDNSTSSSHMLYNGNH